MSAASDTAVHAAASRIARSPVKAVYEDADRIASVALRAAHDSALGSERSVRLGDVLDALRHIDCASEIHPELLPDKNPTWDAANYLAERFGRPNGDQS